MLRAFDKKLRVLPTSQTAKPARHCGCCGEPALMQNGFDYSDVFVQKIYPHVVGVYFLAETEGFEPSSLKGHHDFESSGENRTWRNLTEYNGRCENPENAVFSRLSAPLCIENTVKTRVRKSPSISPSSNGFSGKPIRIFDRTERFFVPKSRFWQCVKSAGYAGLHQKSCRKMPG